MPGDVGALHFHVATWGTKSCCFARSLDTDLLEEGLQEGHVVDRRMIRLRFSVDTNAKRLFGQYLAL